MRLSERLMRVREARPSNTPQSTDVSTLLLSRIVVSKPPAFLKSNHKSHVGLTSLSWIRDAVRFFFLGGGGALLEFRRFWNILIHI